MSSAVTRADAPLAPPIESFPTLRIDATRFEARGSFAEAQARFLRPDAAAVARLDALLHEKRIGVVAHFYMDPELQGVLTSCTWPHIHISDSLVMADRAVAMAEAGAKTIAVLGVDFMSENVRAMLDAAGFRDVPVYRVAADPIGCSLAEAAETPAYGAYLKQAAKTPHALHVVYINTSLLTKAKAHALVPTLTCTSSNVVRTLLQTAAEIPDAHIFFGPDTYMGENLAELLRSLAELPDDAVRALHPAHTAASVRAFLPRFHYFEQGNCIVHHLFGKDVVAQVERDYPDAFVTAHLEVPGEMFSLGLAAQRRGRGVVGSTADILRFIGEKVDAALEAGRPVTLPFVLGTEAGMITPIVRSVQARLAERPEAGVKVDVIFPVATEAIALTADAGLPVVPGVAAGEGCSTAGGCATCPYMKMNSLTALFALCERVEAVPRAALAAYRPRDYAEVVRGRSVAELGGEPILHMRGFQRTGQLPKALVEDILTRVP
jgi:quinolinate synthase